MKIHCGSHIKKRSLQSNICIQIFIKYVVEVILKKQDNFKKKLAWKKMRLKIIWWKLLCCSRVYIYKFLKTFPLFISIDVATLA